MSATAIAMFAHNFDPVTLSSAPGHQTSQELTLKFAGDCQTPRQRRIQDFEMGGENIKKIKKSNIISIFEG